MQTKRNNESKSGKAKYGLHLEPPFSILPRSDYTVLQQYGKGKAGIPVGKRSDSARPGLDRVIEIVPRRYLRHSFLFLFDALVVEMDHFAVPELSVGRDEVHPREQFPVMELHLGNHPPRRRPRC